MHFKTKYNKSKGTKLVSECIYFQQMVNIGSKNGNIHAQRIL